MGKTAIVVSICYIDYAEPSHHIIFESPSKPGVTPYFIIDEYNMHPGLDNNIIEEDLTYITDGNQFWCVDGYSLGGLADLSDTQRSIYNQAVKDYITGLDERTIRWAK